MTHKKLSEPLYKEQLSSYYIDLLSKMPRYCCPVEIFNLVFLVFIQRYNQNLGLLSKTTKQGKVPQGVYFKDTTECTE